MSWVDWNGTRQDYERVRGTCADPPLIQRERCPLCGDLTTAPVPDACRRCRQRYPWPLLKASYDPFDYAVGLVNGLTIRFTECIIEGPWITLRVSDEQQPVTQLSYPCPRGVTIHLDQILWVTDAPRGS